MDARAAEAFARLPDYLGSHVLICATALALGLSASFPLALLSLKRPVLKAMLLTGTSLVQTVPGLALLALFYPLLLALATLSQHWLGVGFSALGFLPAVLALALYSMLPVVQNTIIGLESVAPAVKRAALGVGMTERQSLWMVEIPIALPVILAGVRTASTWVIGTATLATPIGQTSLGNYIFSGLQTQNWVSVLFGCVAAALLAVAVDQFLSLIEKGYSGRRRDFVVAGAVGLLLVLCLAFLPAHKRSTRDYVIGAKPFAEQYILAAALEQRLRAAGFSVATKNGLGSAVIFDALVAGDIDAYVEYSGTLWANQMRRRTSASRDIVLRQVSEWLSRESGTVMLGSLGFENAYALALPKTRAKALKIASLQDLAREAPRLSIAGDYEFFSRPEWAAIRNTYGLAFRQERQMQAEFMYRAASAGEVDVIAAYTSDGRIDQYQLLVLDDPKQSIPPYDSILLVSPKRAGDAAFLDALRPLVGAISVDAMRAANRQVSEGTAPEAAAAWLSQSLNGREKGTR